VHVDEVLVRFGELGIASDPGRGQEPGEDLERVEAAFRIPILIAVQQIRSPDTPTNARQLIFDSHTTKIIMN
jgi:hypothetical protein